MGSAMPHLVVLEPDPRGHTFEWLEFLIRAAGEREPAQRVTFLVAKELEERLSAAFRNALPESVKLVALSQKALSCCVSPNLALSGMTRWWIMRRYLKRLGADYGLFLCLDHLSLPLALGLRAGGREISGILFRPSIHYGEAFGTRSHRRERVRDLRKRILYALMLRNKSLRRIFSLDPYFVEWVEGNLDTGGKIVQIADPILLSPQAGPRPEETSRDRFEFLLFGELTRRKGLLVLLAALEHLHPLVADRCAVVIAGRIEDALRSETATRMAALRRNQPSLSIELRDRRLSPEEVDALVRRCDFVLAPYQRFVGSSGVVLRAADAGKPILTQDYGLLGRLASDHGLGAAVDTTDSRRLAEAISSAACQGMDGHFDPVRTADFAATHSPHFFAATIFGDYEETRVKRDAIAENDTLVPRTGHASLLS